MGAISDTSRRKTTTQAILKKRSPGGWRTR